MAGIMNKIGDALHIGGNKEEVKKHDGDHSAYDQKHDGEKKHDVDHSAYDQKHDGGEHKPEHKEGIIDKIKDKIHGGEDGAGSKEHCGEGEKKKKKEKKKKEDGDHHHDGGSSSSSDSD